MSPIRLPRLQDLTSTFTKLRSRRRPGAVRPQHPLKHRHLLIDPLEERQMLSINPTDSTDLTPTDILVNESYSTSQTTINGQSVAVDNDGDFVVTWARQDTVTYGNNKTTTDWNVYARYFTDEVQRITIPESMLTNSNINSNATMTLRWGGTKAIQTITFTSGYAPETAEYSQALINRKFTLSFDGVEGLFAYNESLGAVQNAKNLQTFLQGMGVDALNGAQVTALSPQEFKIEFDAIESYVQAGQSQPLLTWVDTVVDPADTGFLPAVTVERVSEPILIEGIPVVPNYPSLTAANIQYALSVYAGQETTITVVSETQFDVAFVGDSGKQNLPEMALAAAYDEYSNPLDISTGDVRTLKETSPEFRVNAVEEDNPNTMWADYLDQIKPAVAIDADGDFVITWQSEESVATNPNYLTITLYDIYARRFTPVGYQDDPAFQIYDPETDTYEAIQGVKPLADEFRVNTTTTYSQVTPAIGMDDAGDFTIAWAGFGQDFSYFNSVYLQKYNRDGDRVGNEYSTASVNIPGYNLGLTHEHFDPYVSMSSDGHIALTWTVNDTAGTGYALLVVMQPDDDIILTTTIGAVPYETTSAFDDSNNLLITWTENGTDDQDDDQGDYTSTGVRGMQYQLYDADGNLSVSVITPLTAINSCPSEATTWFKYQGGTQAMLDADGDIVVTYEGYSRDVDQASLPYGGSWGIEPDWQIEWRLAYEESLGATEDELAALRTQLEEQYLWTRGEAYGIQYTRVDASATEGSNTILDTDTVLNSQRQGHNARYYLSFDRLTTGGSLTLRVYNPNGGDGGDAYTDVTIDFANEEGVPIIDDIMTSIEDGLEGIPYVGLAVAEADGTSGTVLVRYLSDYEISFRQGTEWAIDGVDPNDYCFEITFAGSLHDIDVDMFIYEAELEAEPIDEVQVLTFTSNSTGSFALLMHDPVSGQALTSSWITFDSADQDAMAGAIQDALENMTNSDGETPFSGAEVLPLSPLQYQITYGGDTAGTDVGEPQLVLPNVDTGLTPYPGNIVVDTTIDGQPEEPPFPVLIHFTHAAQGETQMDASSGIEPDGDFVSAWTQYEEYTNTGYSNTNIYYRRYDESTDTAGPQVTDFLMPDETRLTTSAQIDEALQYIIVTFDEEMMTTGASSVLDPDNWALLKDGVAVTDGINKIWFGMNKAADLATTLGYASLNGSNKWEAVIKLDGNGATAGVVPLGTGTYTIVAKNTLRDVAGNPLKSTGYNANGGVYSSDFDIMVASSGEERVNSTTTGDQTTQPTSPKTVASDADGDYVVVWTTEGKGVYAKLYNVVWDNTTGRESTTSVVPVINPSTGTAWANNEIRISTNATASYASVARDTDGDFVVTWSEQDASNDWNVWAQRFDAMGNPRGDAFMVNTETEDIQRYSTVAMDNDGDFVITWQSYGQDESGYGIYAQRFDPAGTPVGGTNEIQLLSFVDGFLGSFKLKLDGKTTSNIAYNSNAFDITDELVSAFAAIGIEIKAEATSLSTINITFTGDDGSKDQSQIEVASATVTSGSSGRVEVATRVDGATAEFRVNDTTIGNQQYPDIAMSDDGSFVITWTSYGQDEDAAYETNVYAKRFFSNDVITGGSTTTSATKSSLTVSSADVPSAGSLAMEPTIVTTDDPNNHIVTTGSGYDGVVLVEVGGVSFGSGALLTTGMHILTAAHVVAAAYGSIYTDDVTVTFHLASGDVVYEVTDIFVNPDYTGVVGSSAGDLAVLVLESPAPSSVERYDIYRDSDEEGRVFTKVGYGATGTGDTGYIITDMTKRSGQNRYEVISSDMQEGNASDGLGYDFDSGLTTNDTFGSVFRIYDNGLGTSEMSGAPGDSGGPNFIDGKIAGVTSYIGSYGGTTDAVFGTNASFGDIGVDVRVSLYADWIDSALESGAAEFLVNQTTDNNQQYSSVAMDANGNFVVTWSSYNQDGVGSGPGASFNGENGIYARRYDADAIAMSDEFLVNTFAANNQQYSRVAMDSDGDFVITWESYQDQSGSSDTPNSYGIYAQRYARYALIGENEFLGINGEIGSEFMVNATVDGNQRYPGVAMDATGDFVIVWSGNGTVTGQADTQGIFQQFYQKEEDDTGPTVSNVYNIVSLEGQNVRATVAESQMFQDDISQFVVCFSEDLDTSTAFSGLHSVKNLNNWNLLYNGQMLVGGIASVVYGLNSATGKYEAVVTFDSDSTTAGNQALGEGVYVLTIRDRVEDLFENALDGNYDGKAGGNFSRSFSVRVGTNTVPDGPEGPNSDDEDEPVNDNELFEQNGVVVATSADGDYVVIWVTYGGLGDTVAQGNIVGQRYDRFGEKQGNEFLVSSYYTGDQSMPDVAMDDYGNFIVVWAGTGIGLASNNDSTLESDGIFGRLFDAFGVAQGDQFRINQYRVGTQTAPAVTMDANGDFVVSWSGEGTEDKAGVYARTYTASGVAKGNQFFVNSYTSAVQDSVDVAMDSDGEFVIVWASAGQDGSSWGVYGRRYSAAGTALSGEFRINDHTDNAQYDPQIAMDADGDFVVAWTSSYQDGGLTGVYAKRYTKAGVAVGGEFQVNQTAAGSQSEPAVSMADSGMFVITWSTIGQDNFDKLGENDTIPSDYGIYARIFNADGSDYRYDLDDDGTAEAIGEFRVNATTTGDQLDSSVAMDADGDFVVGWVGPDLDETGIYHRIVVLNPSTYVEVETVNQTSAYGLVVEEPLIRTSSYLVLNGTTGNDLFEFTGGSAATSWTVKINGVVQSIASNVVAIIFNGLAGTDRVKLTGTALAEEATLKSGTVTFAGSGFTVTANSVENIRVDGAGGSDTVRMYDGSGDDTLTVKAGTATLTGSVTYTALNCETVHAYASDGNDTANLYDSAGDNLLEMSPNFGRITGDGIVHRAVGFEAIQAYASTGTDEAVFAGTSGNEVFQATPTWAKMTGAGYTKRQANGFDTVTAYGNGGSDTAKLTGSASTNDTLKAWQQKATFTGTGFKHVVDGFGTITAYGGAGGSDTAQLYDSAGNDTFRGSPQTASMSYAATGDLVSVSQFELIQGISSSGGTDTAYLYDSAGNDTFWANSTLARMYGTGFNLRASGFDYMHGTASSGRDVAKLYGTAAAETIRAETGMARVYGKTFFQRARYFDEVYIDAEGGTDTATVYDSTVPTGYTMPAGTKATDYAQLAWLYDIESIQLRKTTDATVKTNISKVDSVFTYWS